MVIVSSKSLEKKLLQIQNKANMVTFNQKKSEKKLLQEISLKKKKKKKTLLPNGFLRGDDEY